MIWGQHCQYRRYRYPLIPRGSSSKVIVTLLFPIHKTKVRTFFLDTLLLIIVWISTTSPELGRHDYLHLLFRFISLHSPHFFLFLSPSLSYVIEGR